MDISVMLEKAIEKQKEIVARINALGDDKRNLLQEALRLDGEIRLLKSMANENKTKPTGE